MSTYLFIVFYMRMNEILNSTPMLNLVLHSYIINSTVCLLERSFSMSEFIHTQKHITLSDRIFIEQALSIHESFKNIAAVLKKDPSTISKEIRKHRIFKNGSHYNPKNNCAFLSSCNHFRICDGKSYHLESFSYVT